MLVLGIGIGACDSTGSSAAVEPPALETREALAPAESSAVEVLRRLSLDLRGRLPSWEEVQTVRDQDAVPEAMLDAMLDSPEFLDQVERWHAEILWPELSRYQLKASSLAAYPADAEGPAMPYLLGVVPHEGNVSPDPLLPNDAEARLDHVVAIEDEAWAGARRGGHHAYSNMYCDLRPEAEYPDPSVVGSPDNRYTVPASRSGSGQAYEGTYYSEDEATYGMVLPLQDFAHCPNYCRRSDCSLDVYEDADNIGPRAGCFADMDTPGDDPSGRHRFDTPGMRCADGYEREINACNLTEDIQSRPGGARGTQGWFPRRARRTVAENSRVTSYNSQVEGWRWMEHYWSRGEKIKTCAYEAQENELGVWARTADGEPVPCEEATPVFDWYYTDPSCGCGPKGAYCQPSIAGYLNTNESFSEYRLRHALEQEPLQIVRSVVERDEDYLAILTTARSFVNGPLAFAFAEQSNVLGGQGFRGITPPAEDEPVWDEVSYDDPTWSEYERPARHSGILTTLGFLVRFPTYRARVTQYRRNFLCSEEFDYAPNPDPSDVNPDIANRNGCSSCHGRLETDGMFFARYPDRTGVWLESEAYPVTSEACTYCFENGSGCGYGEANPHVAGGTVSDPDMAEICGQHYSWLSPDEGTPEQQAYNGTIRAAMFRTEAEASLMDEGPQAMVARDLAAGDQLQRCTARTAWDRLLRRPPSETELDALVQGFEADGRSYRSLIRTIVSSASYRSLALPPQ